MWNWFKRLPIGKKIRVIAWGAVGLSILGLMLGFALESPQRKAHRLRNQAIQDAKMEEQLEFARKDAKLLDTYKNRFGYRPEHPYSEQEKARLMVIYAEIYGNK